MECDMSNLIEYVQTMKQYQKEHPEKSETEIVRHIYLDLGSKLSFDLNFYFGNSETRQRIYQNQNSKDEEALKKCMENETAICKSMSYIMEYVLKSLGINATTVIVPGDCRKCAHMYNIVKPKAGKPYIIDLQEDIRNIQSHSRTRKFGLSTRKGETPVICFTELESMDRKEGYISDENYYADDYFYLLKYDTGLIEDLREKAKFIFENLEPYEKQEMKCADRAIRLEELIEKLFTFKERRKIHIIDCYYEEKDKSSYESCIAVYVGKETDTDVYRFSEEDKRFHRRTIDEFALEVSKGLKHKQDIWGLKGALKRLENQQR